MLGQDLSDLQVALCVGVDIKQPDVGQLLGAVVDDRGDVHGFVAEGGGHLLNSLIDGVEETSAEFPEGLEALDVMHGVILLQEDHPRVGGFLLEEGRDGL